MKTILLLFFILPLLKTYGQTDSLERVALNQHLQARKISKIDASYITRKWNEFRETSNYPVLPFNTDGKLQYSYIIDFPETSKEIIFKRILEWLSLTYDILPAYVYSNADDGKIICSNNVVISGNTTGTYSFVFSIKDEKVLMDFANIGYKVTSGGYYSGENWVPDRIDYHDINAVFPIILKSMFYWKDYFNILETLDKRFNGDIKSVSDYIINYNVRYEF